MQLFNSPNGLLFVFSMFRSAPCLAYSQAENIGRGVVAVRDADTPNRVFISWRMLKTDPIDIAFNIYRGDTKINTSPIVYTNITDTNVANSTYTVKPVI